MEKKKSNSLKDKQDYEAMEEGNVTRGSKGGYQGPSSAGLKGNISVTAAKRLAVLKRGGPEMFKKVGK